MAARKSALWSQTSTLANKNFTILFSRKFTSTIYTALVLPIILSVYLGLLQNVGTPQDDYGIGDPRPVRSFRDALSAASSSRDTIVFINNDLGGGDIDSVIGSLSRTAQEAGFTVRNLTDDAELPYICESSYQGASNCFGAVVFNSSPDEGEGGAWNYTLRGDRSLGRDFKVKKDSNDAQVYALPLQRAVDEAIAGISSDGGNDADLGNTEEWPFTDETESERQARVRKNYQNTFTMYNSVALSLVLSGLVYRLPGMIATERESGLSQLIDAMMPTAYDWEAQLARMLSFFYSYTITYFPGWVAASVIVHFLLWKSTNIGIIIVFFILAGLSVTSMGLMGGALFRKAQLSGAVNNIAFLVLAAVAQGIPNPPTAAVVVLSLLFAPSNIIFFFIYVAKYEGEGWGADLLQEAPHSNSRMPGLVHWIFAIIHFLVYPCIAAYLERAIHGVAAESRQVYKGHASEKPPQDAVSIDGLTKVYTPSLFRRIFSFMSKPRAPTVAVNNLTLSAKKGQILSLLGANGSGKSTTLDAIAGLHRFNHGSVSIDASGGIGHAPQKNVLWADLTVMEHMRIFNHLKSPSAKASEQDILDLIESIGLTQKIKARVETLSGGQKRKLQLGMMLTGGSSLCCVDEVSSGIDPLSRRKIWDILLSERGRRTIILTTHFLDEADLLSDDIAILSKGELRAQGSPVVLKDQLGAGYRVHVLNAKNVTNPPTISGVSSTITSTNIVYTAPSSQLAAKVIRVLEAAGLEYRMSSPTIEDVFLHVAEEVKGELSGNVTSSPDRGALAHAGSDDSTPTIKQKQQGLELLTGKQTGFFKQVMTLAHKRFVLFKTNWIPYVVAFLVPIIAAAATQTLVMNKDQVGCAPAEQGRRSDAGDYMDLLDDALLVAGPRDRIVESVAGLLQQSGLSNMTGSSSDIPFEFRNSWSDFRAYVEDHRKEVMPGGIWLGSGDQTPTFAYRADSSTSVISGIMTQNLLNSMRTNMSISTSYIPFDLTTPPGITDYIMLTAFFCIAVSIAPAFFGFYPNVERRSSVRGLQYSSGVRSFPLWVSHLSFDFSIFCVAFLIAAIVYAVSSDAWYSPGYLFPVFILYGLVTILLAYVWSLFMKSQLATFAAIFVYNVVGFSIYFIAFLFIISFTSVTEVESSVLIGHFVISIFFPVGSLFRSLMVGLNLFATSCDGYELYSYPGHINAYGGPILYLTVQALLLFGFLLWWDSGNKLPSFLTRRNKGPQEPSWQPQHDQENADELARVYADGNQDGLQVKNLVKVFGDHTAVDNVTFGVQHGEVFALLGPNGAGKSTTISLIRGDIQPSKNGGDVFVEKISVTDRRALARANLGVCPQFDAVDNMTVLEHLRHYARLRGITDVERQIHAVVNAVGLEAFTETMAPHLSGGNKRKLSLGIALTGNPSVILLDEPSSGLDAAAKRIMWRTLEKIVPGRSILLTTHSMEEADALASRAGILAQRMLAVGEVETLRQRFGDSLYVHLVSKTAPHSTPIEMERMRAWVQHLFPSAQIEPETYHGQMRFSVPASAVRERARTNNPAAAAAAGNATEGSVIGQLIVLLEEHKAAMGVEHHSVSPTTLNDVFLSIVGRHNVLEEGYTADVAAAAQPKRGVDWKKVRKMLFMF